MCLKHGEELAEFHDLIDIEDALFKHADDRRVQRGQFLQPVLVEIGRRQCGELALKIDVIGDLFAVAQFVHECDADRDLALELVGRPNADRFGEAGAPLALGIIVADAGFVLERRHIGGADQRVFDRGVDLLQKRQRHIAGQIDRAWRLAQHEAGLRDIHIKFFGIGLLCRFGGAGFAADHRLSVVRKQRQEFFLDRLAAGPIVERHQRRLAAGPGPGMIAKFDRARRDPRGVDLARGAHIVDAKFRRLRDGVRAWRGKPCAGNRGNHCRAPHARSLARTIDQFSRPPQKNSRNGLSLRRHGWKKPCATGGGCDGADRQLG